MSSKVGRTSFLWRSSLWLLGIIWDLSASPRNSRKECFWLRYQIYFRISVNRKYCKIVFSSLKTLENNDGTTFLRTEKVTEHLEALIDPFDLDVFTLYLNSNLHLLVQRTSVSCLKIPSAWTKCHSPTLHNRPAQQLVLREAVLAEGDTQAAE